MRSSDWSSDVCSSDLAGMVVVPESTVVRKGRLGPGQMIAVDLKEGAIFIDREIKDRIAAERPYGDMVSNFRALDDLPVAPADATPSWSKTELTRRQVRSEEHTSELQSLMRISSAVFCLK